MKSKNYDLAIAAFRKILAKPETAQKIKERGEIRDSVLARYQPIFSSKNIRKLTEEDFRSFLYFENNQHWSSLYRHVTTLTADMDNLQSSLSILVDSSRPLAGRFDKSLEMIKGFGKALATAILLVSSPKEYGVWNSTSEDALKQLNLWHDFVQGKTPGQQYEQVNKLLLQLSQDLGIDLWTLDDLIWRVLLSDDEDETIEETKAAPVLDSVSHSFMNEIHHPELKERISRLSTAPLDTVIREAGVVFEHYLRKKVDPNSNKFGVDLIDDALKGGDKIVFSTHGGEQQGVYFLFRGAMQFIRNPPMHKIIDYPESMAHQCLRLIDSLMTVLDHGAMAGEVTVDDIRFMLRNRNIRPNHRVLYNTLYKAGTEGMTSTKLAEAMKLTPQQLSGVMGSLGRTINTTDGLKDKGGTIILFEVKETNNSEWSYIMRPILRTALEEENLI